MTGLGNVVVARGRIVFQTLLIIKLLKNNMVDKNKGKCPKCKKLMPVQPGSRDYTDLCSDCFAKSFVNSISENNMKNPEPKQSAEGWKAEWQKIRGEGVDEPMSRFYEKIENLLQSQAEKHKRELEDLIVTFQRKFDSFENLTIVEVKKEIDKLLTASGEKGKI